VRILTVQIIVTTS